MSDEIKHESKSCCCCQSWKAIFITIALLLIGAVFGHILTAKHHCGHMKGKCVFDMRGCWDRGQKECPGFEHKGWLGKDRPEMGKCQPGCKCPICSQKASMSEPDKTNCPMMDKKEGKPKKK